MTRTGRGGGTWWVVALAVTVLVALTGLANDLGGRPAASHDVADVVRASSIQQGVAPGARASVLAASPSSWAGTTAETLLPNYNGSLPGDLRSEVYDWEVGAPALVPSTGIVWWPEFPVSVGGSPLPTVAPALEYNTATDSIVGIDPALTNLSALVYDPQTETLFGTCPLNATVLEINSGTGVPTGEVYHVGADPSAIAFDPTTGYLFVANAASSSVTVINPVAKTVLWASIAVGHDPTLLADDGPDGWMYVGNWASAYLSRLDVSDPTTAEPVTLLREGAARGLAFSPETDNLAVTTQNGTNLTIVQGSSGAVTTTTVGIGSGFAPVETSANGGTFVVANMSGSELVLVNASTFSVASQRLSVGPEPSELLTDGMDGEVFSWSNTSRNVSVVSNSLGAVSQPDWTLGPEPSSVVYSSSLHALYVGDASLPGLEAINMTTGHSMSRPIPLPSPLLSLAMALKGSSLYVALEGAVDEFNASTGLLEVQNTLLPGPNGPLALDTAAGTLWVGRSLDNDAIALNISTLMPTGRASPVQISPSDPDALIFAPGTGTMVAINASSGDVVQFNASTGALLGPPVSAGANLTSLAWDPAARLVYAAGDGLSAVNLSSMTVELNAPLLAPHTRVGGMTYEASREAMYIGTWVAGSYSGTVTVVNASSVAATEASVTVVATGFEPAGLAAIPSQEGDPADSGVVVTANEGSGTLSVIASPPQILAASFAPAAVDQNVSTDLRVFVSGGALGSTATFSPTPPGCAPVSALELACVPSEAGSFDVGVTVTDSIGQSVSSSAELLVASALKIFSTVGASPLHEADVGVAVVMSARATGGTPGYSFAWGFGDGDEASGTSVTHAYAGTGVYVVSVTVRDNGSGSTVNETALTVVDDPSVAVSAAPAATTDVNESLVLSETVSGGVGVGSGLWTFGDGTSAHGAVVEHAWGRAGLYQVNYTYTDAIGVGAEGSLSVLVNPLLQGQFSVIPRSSPAVVGTTFEFNATLSGGTRGYSVVWSFGDGSLAEGAEVTHAYSAPGEYEVEVEATDAAGANVNDTFRDVRVGSAPSGAAPVFGGGFGPSFVLGLVVGGALAAVVLFVAERSRRRGPAGPPSPYVPPPVRTGRGRS